MTRNPYNPTCSRTLEGYREFLKNHKPSSPEEEKLLNDTLEILSRKSNAKTLGKADKVTDCKRYNSQSLDHSKVSREICENPVLKDLSGNSCKVLLFVISCISQDSLIAFTNNTLSEVLGMTRQTVSKSIQELIDNHVIKCIVKGNSPRLQESSIYELSDEWATVGKRAIKKLKPDLHSDFNLVECKRSFDVYDDYDDDIRQVTSRYYEIRLT